MMHAPLSGNRVHSGSVASNLTECARNFLNYDVNAIPFDLSQGPRADADMRRLAMRLLENALPLSTAAQGLPLASGQGAGPWSRSH